MPTKKKLQIFYVIGWFLTFGSNWNSFNDCVDYTPPPGNDPKSCESVRFVQSAFVSTIWPVYQGARFSIWLTKPWF